MILKDLDVYFKGLLAIEENAGADVSINGLQIGDLEQDVKRIAFAVDSGLEVVKRASEMDADMLFVHHGLFWGRQQAIVGQHFNRVKAFIDSDMALYAVHLPLDVHPSLGNNAGIAMALGLEEFEPFGSYKGMKIGFKGVLDKPLSVDDVISCLGLCESDCLRVLRFGKDLVSSVGFVSGGAVFEVFDAIDEGLDLYITGDAGHEVYHNCKEAGINMISGGHYNTETFGVKLVSEFVKRDLGLETFFIDVPTGL